MPVAIACFGAAANLCTSGGSSRGFSPGDRARAAGSAKLVAGGLSEPLVESDAGSADSPGLPQRTACRANDWRARAAVLRGLGGCRAPSVARHHLAATIGPIAFGAGRAEGFNRRG